MIISLNSFCIGFATAYFAICSYYMFFMEHQGNRRLHKMLGYIYLYWSFATAKDLILTFPGMYNEQVLNAVTVIDGWSAITYLMFLYEITRPGWLTLKHLFRVAFPFAIYTVAYCFLPCKHQIITATYIFLISFGLYITIVGYLNAKRYITYIHSYYSNVEHIDISWIKKFFWMAALSLLAWLAICLINNPYLDCFYYVVAILLWQLAYKHCKTLMQLNNTDVHMQILREELVQESEIAYPFAGKMEKIVEEEELYMDPNLMLDTLAKRLSTNRTYLSNYFTTVIGKPFYDYINEMRIRNKCIPLMLEHPEYTLDYIATASGFNSISTFRRAFYKVTGKKPGAFKENKQEN